MEKQLIDIICKTLREEEFAREGARLIGDDAAIVNLGGAVSKDEYLFSVDNLVEGVHYDPKISKPADIGWKAAAVNISDIAAMAGIPLYFLVGISLARSIADKPAWVQGFYRGMNECAKQYGMPQVIGGDITAAEQTMISVTIIGKSGPRGIMKRIGTKFGEKVCVTGKFGNARSFLERVRDSALTEQKPAEIEQWLRREWNGGMGSDIACALKPRPRLREAHGVWKNNKSGILMDSSDGLIASLYELAEKNFVRIEIDTDSVPRDKHVSLEQALYGGEEYELVGCFREVPEGFKAIGVVTGGSIGVFPNNGGPRFSPSKGFQHF